MKTKLLKVLCVAIAIVCVSSMVGVISYATRENIISSSEIAAKPGDTIQVPVFISENTGIMGFSIEIDVDESYLEPISVERGEVLKDGLFENSMGTSDNKGKFKVIWCGTENMNENGILFTMVFNVSKEAEGNTTIKINYDEKDTFDQEWNDKKLTCDDIIISVNKDSEIKLTLIQKIRNMFVAILDWFISLFK